MAFALAWRAKGASACSPRVGAKAARSSRPTNAGAPLRQRARPTRVRAGGTPRAIGITTCRERARLCRTQREQQSRHRHHKESRQRRRTQPAAPALQIHPRRVSSRSATSLVCHPLQARGRAAVVRSTARRPAGSAAREQRARASSASAAAAMSPLVAAIRLYQRTISTLLPPACRFTPSCSEYAAQAIERHGAWRGLRLASVRLLRCGPWHPGGEDPVP